MLDDTGMTKGLLQKQPCLIIIVSRDDILMARKATKEGGWRDGLRGVGAINTPMELTYFSTLLQTALLS
jgi:hypothetical protein